jgi:hypothetical protein
MPVDDHEPVPEVSVPLVHGDATAAGVVRDLMAQYGLSEIPGRSAGVQELRGCPDGGACHHACPAVCWRVANCGPLSAAHYPDDEWPAEVLREHAGIVGGHGNDYPWAQDLDGTWHGRPPGDPWMTIHGGHVPGTLIPGPPVARTSYAGPQCRTLCGEGIHSVHVSQFHPGELLTGPGESLCPCAGLVPVVHACPPDGGHLMPCCGRTPFEALADRITIDPGLVTCPGKGSS